MPLRRVQGALPGSSPPAASETNQDRPNSSPSHRTCARRRQENSSRSLWLTSNIGPRAALHPNSRARARFVVVKNSLPGLEAAVHLVARPLLILMLTLRMSAGRSGSPPGARRPGNSHSPPGNQKQCSCPWCFRNDRGCRSRCQAASGSPRVGRELDDALAAGPGAAADRHVGRAVQCAKRRPGAGKRSCTRAGTPAARKTSPPASMTPSTTRRGAPIQAGARPAAGPYDRQHHAARQRQEEPGRHGEFEERVHPVPIPPARKSRDRSVRCPR